MLLQQLHRATELRLLWFVAVSQAVWCGYPGNKHENFTKLFDLHEEWPKWGIWTLKSYIGLEHFTNTLWTHYRSFEDAEVCKLWLSAGKLCSFSNNWETWGTLSLYLSYLLVPAIKFHSIIPSAEIWQLLHTYPPKIVSPAKIRLSIIIQWDSLVRFRRENTLLALHSSGGLWSGLDRNCQLQGKDNTYTLAHRKEMYWNLIISHNICQIQAISYLLYILISSLKYWQSSHFIIVQDDVVSKALPRGASISLQKSSAMHLKLEASQRIMPLTVCFSRWYSQKDCWCMM